MTSPEDFGVTPEVLAEAEAAARAARPLLDFGVTPEVLAEAEAAARAARPLLDLLQSMRPVMEIVERQHAAMETIRQSFETAMRMQPPPETREAIAIFLHQVRDQQLLAAEFTVPRQDAERALLTLMPQTPGEVDQVRQSVGEIEETPELSGKLHQIVNQVDWAKIGELTPWGALVLAARLLFQIADQPLTGNMSTAQIAALQNRFMVLAVILALAQIILMMRRN